MGYGQWLGVCMPWLDVVGMTMETHVQALADRRTRLRPVWPAHRSAINGMATASRATCARQPSMARRVGNAAAHGIAAAPHGRASSGGGPTPQRPRWTGRPARLAGHGQRAGTLKTHRRDDVVPLRRDDRAHSGEHAEDVLCTVFKAPTATKPLLQNLNSLSYTQDGI